MKSEEFFIGMRLGLSFFNETKNLTSLQKIIPKILVYGVKNLFEFFNEERMFGEYTLIYHRENYGVPRDNPARYYTEEKSYCFAGRLQVVDDINEENLINIILPKEFQKDAHVYW